MIRRQLRRYIVRGQVAHAMGFGSPLPFLDFGGMLKEFVRQAFPGHLLDDVHLVVVAQGSGQLLVGHIGAVLLVTPQLGQAGGVDDAEHEVHAVVVPAHEVAAHPVPLL